MLQFVTRLWPTSETWYRDGFVTHCDAEIVGALGKGNFRDTFGGKQLKKLTKPGSPIA